MNSTFPEYCIPHMMFLILTGTIAFGVSTMAGCGSGASSPPLQGNPSPLLQGNPTVLENEKPGDSSWVLTNPATNHEIEGYASSTSVNRAERISLFVNTANPSYTLEVFRMGWYSGAGARRVFGPITLAGIQQPSPAIDSTTGFLECQWTNPYVLNIPDNSSDPTDWASGVYLVKLTGQATGKQAYIIFVVRDDARDSDLLLNVSMNTYGAYNDWGGRSLYSDPRAFKVSFNKPFVRGYGAGDFLWQTGRWEFKMLRFLEREGYDVTYSTDVDTHTNGGLLLKHKANLVVGHSEYWTWQMRDNWEKARDSGINLAFFSANESFWQIRYEPSAATGDLNRTIVCYKQAALTQDPMMNEPGQQYLTTTLFYNPPVNRPASLMVGLGYGGEEISSLADLVVNTDSSSSWIFDNTAAQNGTHFRGLLGYEEDSLSNPGPPNAIRHEFLKSPYIDPLSGTTRYSEGVFYETQAGSAVVSVGSMQWNWGLDSDSSDQTPLANAIVQQATRNILARFGAIAGTPPG